MYPYEGYDHKVDIKNDDFLNSMTREEQQKFDEAMMKMWTQRHATPKHKGDQWYMILEGQMGRKVALYQDHEEFVKVRDEHYKAPGSELLPEGKKGWSWKACHFEDLAAAKNYIQMAREEEGRHWQWPDIIPVYWKKGPITQMDCENFPGFLASLEEEE